MERQVLSGILPIQNVEPVLYFIAQRMPLEVILKLRHPDLEDYAYESDGPRWTADELLSTYALSQGESSSPSSRSLTDNPLAGFITAKAGRPDLYRGGAYILRQLHSSNIPWGFRPPFAGDATAQDQEGIWIPNFKAKASTASELARERELAKGDRNVEDYGSEGEDSQEEEEEEEEDDDQASEEDEDSDDDRAVAAVRSIFAGLEVEGGDDSEDEDEE